MQNTINNMEITALELSDKLGDEIRPLARKVFMANVANGVAQLSNKQASTIARPTELWFYVPLDTKQVISETFPRANLLAWCGKN